MSMEYVCITGYFLTEHRIFKKCAESSLKSEYCTQYYFGFLHTSIHKMHQSCVLQLEKNYSQISNSAFCQFNKTNLSHLLKKMCVHKIM